MSDLINRKELWKAFTTKFDCVCSLGEVRKTIDSIPVEEPTIDAIAERIEVTTWYHINQNGKLVEGASGREEALYKASDIFRILEEMGASDVYEIDCAGCDYFFECITTDGYKCPYKERKNDDKNA